MLTAAGIGASGPRGMVRAQGLALLFGSVLRTWVNDDDPGLARTMAALDRALGRGQRFVGPARGSVRQFRRGFAGCGRGGDGRDENPRGGRELRIAGSRISARMP